MVLAGRKKGGRPKEAAPPTAMQRPHCIAVGGDLPSEVSTKAEMKQKDKITVASIFTPSHSQRPQSTVHSTNSKQLA
jgi:hypothetical protein